MKATFGALIPFYNEEERIVKVLKELKKVKALTQIVCVNDGSTDQSAKRVTKTLPDCTLVSLKSNQGKTEAIRAGVKQLKTNFILLIDADLRRFDYREIARAIAVLEQDPRDMLILRRVNSILSTKLIRGDILLTGERIIKRSSLLKILKEPVSNFQIEMAVNHHFLNRPKTIGWAPLSALSTFKIEKRGLLEGLWGEFRMAKSLWCYRGLKYYLKQMYYSYLIPKLV